MSEPAVLRDPPPAVLEIENLKKLYGMDSGAVLALKGISMLVRRGEFVSIMGQSGSGKSTLLHILGCLHRATSGIYKLDGIDVAGLNDDQLSALRNMKIGFVFQKFNLLSHSN